MSALVTVVVPVYNAEKSIGACIHSLLQQTYSKLQILIIDDGSTDHSMSIIDEISLSNDNIKVVHQQNQGVSAARNTGLSQAEGDYICFVDSDDTVEADYVSHLYELLCEQQADISACGYREQREDEILYATKGDKVLLDQQTAMEYLLMEGYFRGYVWNKLFDLNIIRQNGLVFDHTLALWEDVLFVLQYLRYCSKICYDPDPKYTYMFLDTSTSHNANHILGVERSYHAILAQKKIQALVPDAYTNVLTRLIVRQVQSALSVIRNIGYQNTVDREIYRDCLYILNTYADKISTELTAKERRLVFICRYFPALLLLLYKIKGRQSVR